MKPKFTVLLLVGFINISQPDVTTAQVDVQDSLALVDLYNSTNGPHWYHRSGWLSKPVKKWYGISVSERRVTGIFLFDNNLKGNLPSSLGNLTQLRSFHVVGNQLSGSIPSFLGDLTKLESLWLFGNQLSGSIPSSLGNLTNLIALHLNDNQLTGSIPRELGNLANLQELILVNNLLSGSIPPELGNLTNLQSVYLYNNQLSGSIPAELGKLTNLVYLLLNFNQLSGSIPSELGNLTFLYNLRLDNNQLTGSIPPELGNLTYLGSSFNNYLDLSNNQLSGSIPPELGKLSFLKYLYLNSNQLTGNIPSSFGDLAELVVLDLRNNKLKNSIPSDLGNLSNLKHLRLSHNKLSGNVPSSFSNLTKLLNLNVGDNILSGTAPSFLTTLPQLKKLNLLHNHYTFDGLEKLVQSNDFNTLKYERERLIDLHQNKNTLSVYAGGTLSNNTYKWFKDGALYATISGDSTLPVTENGAYNVEVSNAIATELTLYSDTIIYAGGIAQDMDASQVNKSDKMLTLSLYPNPANTYSTLVVNATGIYRVQVNDMSGKVLQIKNITATKSQTRIYLNVSSYAPGIYFVTVIDGKQRRSIKLKKEY